MHQEEYCPFGAMLIKLLTIEHPLLNSYGFITYFMI